MLDGFRLTRKSLHSQRINRAFDTSTAPVQHVHIDHRGLHVIVAEKLLHDANVIARLDQVRGKRMPERVTGYPFRHSRLLNGLLECLL